MSDDFVGVHVCSATFGKDPSVVNFVCFVLAVFDVSLGLSDNVFIIHLDVFYDTV